MKYLLACVLLLGWATARPSAARGDEAATATPAPPWTAKELRLVDEPGEIVAVLANGMTAIVKEHHTAPVAAVRIHVRAGSIYEQERLGAGMSHLFEHLMAGGETTQRDEEETRRMIEELGAHFNAYTGKDRTAFFLTVRAELVGKALDLVADWVMRPTFPEEAFQREMGVVQRELEMNATDPDRVMWYLFDALRYQVHPARYPVIGHQEVVRQLTREDILAYYDRVYVPENMVVAVVGNINAEAMLARIRETFAAFPRRPGIHLTLPSEPPVTAPRRAVHVFPAMRGPAKMLIGLPSFPLQHEDLYALDTLASIVGDGRSSRLYRRLVEQDRLGLAVWAANYTPYWAEGSFLINVTAAPDNVAAAEAVVWEVLNEVARDGVTDEELARARRRIQGAHVRSQQTAAQQANTMANDFLATGEARFSEHYVNNIQMVTAEEVQTAARRYFDAQRQLTLVLTPTELPVDDNEVTTAPGDSPVRRIVLDNGLRVLLKRNSSVPLVNMQLYVLGGLLEETAADNGITNLMVELSTRGAEEHSAAGIAAFFEGIGGVLEADCGNNTFFWRAEVFPEDFAPALEMFSTVALAPTFPDDELEQVRQQTLAIIAQRENSWHAAATRYFRAQFYADSPYQRVHFGDPEVVAQITRDDIEDFHREKMAGSRSVLAVFGDIDLDAAEATVRATFDAMPRGEAFATPETPGPRYDARRLFVKETPKEGAAIYVGFPGAALGDVSDRYALDIVRQIVGSQTGWLHETLRGAGLVYATYGINFVGVAPGYFALVAQCEAAEAPRVIEIIEEHVARAAQGKFSDEEIARAQSRQINAEVLDRQTNADMAMAAALDELYGFGYDWAEHYADRIMALTPAEVRDAAARYLDKPPTIAVITSAPDLLPTP